MLLRSSVGTAISNHRIVSCLDDQVTFTWTPSGTRTAKRRTLLPVEFLQLFGPSGFIVGRDPVRRSRSRWQF